MSRSLDIGLDIDGVLYPFVQVIAGYAAKVLGRPCTGEAETWDWYQRQWGLNHDEFFALCSRSVRDGVLFTEGAPLPGAMRAAKRLARAGHRLHYITARGFAGVPAPVAWHRTAEWLQKWTFPVHSLTVSGDKNCRPTDVFLDDSPHICEALVASGHPHPVLWCNRPSQIHDVDTVFSWDQFIQLVEAESGPLPELEVGYAVY
jgi:5' nucleotidase, deoxy (Pyrimidine), cytosolic type C protein (NT5C)